MRRVQTLVDVICAVRACPARLITRRTTDRLVTRPSTRTAALVNTVLAPVTVGTFYNAISTAHSLLLT